MKTLISFGSGGYENGLTSLGGSAKRYFDCYNGFTPADLDEAYWRDNAEIVKQPRGFGYWLWKPYLILRCLKNLGADDYLMYSDALVNFIDDPAPLFPLTEQNGGIVVFDQKGVDGGRGTHINRIWTKADCFNIMECNSPEYTDGIQLTATFLVLKRTDRSVSFVEEWLRYCSSAAVVTDAPNITGPNLDGFKDHRHDQSVLSLLAIKHKLRTFKDISQYGADSTDPESKYGQIVHHHRSL